MAKLQSQQPYIDTEDRIDENIYYYALKVLDSNNKGIKNAKVQYDNVDNYTFTDQNGLATWEKMESIDGSNNNASRCLDVIVSCPGYVSQRMTRIIGQPIANYSNPPTITLPSAAIQGYNYKILVKDSNTGNPISGAQVEMRNISENVIDNDIHNKTVSDGTFIYYSETDSKLKFKVTKNGYQDSDLIIVNGSTDTAVATTILLKPNTAAFYYYVIAVKDTTGKPVRNVQFELYTNFALSSRYDENTYTTDERGLISIPLGFSNLIPPFVFAKGVSIPLGYEWDNVVSGKVAATLSETEPGCNITVKTLTVSSVYYYNLKVVDLITEQPLKDVNISYLYNGTVLSSRTTDKTGISYFSSNYNSVVIKASKSGYSTGYENGINLSGNISETSYRQITATPNNTIKVEYDDGSPAKNVYVTIFTYDESRNYMLIGRFGTHANGYIDSLSPSCYNMGGLKATISTHSNRVWTVTPGDFVITIDKSTISSEDRDIKQFTQMSAYGLKRSVNNDRVYYDGGNDFKVRIQDPDSITTFDIFTSSPVMMYNSNKKNIIGSVDITLKPDVNDLRLKVLNRYSGYYNPIFKDILFYKNFWSDRKELPYTNSTFDYQYEDNLGKFGYINNLWFHKVNDRKNVNILDTLRPFYPITGQYALDYKDYNIFSSNWDMNYFTRQIDAEHSEPCNNIASMKNGLCMFGSKYLNVPEVIEINGLHVGGEDIDWDGEWNDDWITNPEGCPGEVMFKEVNNNSVDFYFFLTKRIIRYMTEKLYGEFSKYVSDQNSFGEPGIEDDIEEYVKKNVLKLYKLDKVRMFVRRTKKGLHNSRIENDYTTYMEYYRDGKTLEYKPVDVEFFRTHGFVEVNTLHLSKVNRDDFDRKLVYNLRNGAKEEFGFCFRLKKI